MVTVNAEQFDSVLLVGFMASGKSSVGRELSTLLGWKFTDMDAAIEKKTGSPIDILFNEKGENYFRGIESEIALELVPLKGTVLATGGGWALSNQNWRAVPEDTLTVWLKVTPEVAFKRALNEGLSRPLFDQNKSVEEFALLLKGRRHWYGRARHSVDSEQGEPQEIAESIVKFIDSPDFLIDGK